MKLQNSNMLHHNKRKFMQIILIFLLITIILLLYNKKLAVIDSPKYINNNNRFNLINILMWTHKHTEPFKFFKSGRDSFADCSYNNCYITNHRDYLDILEWDAILFHAPEYTWDNNPWNHGNPSIRKKEQIYIFVSIESSANYPVNSKYWDGYFNWTMTYRLDSDVPWLYFNVKDLNNNIIGPDINVKWISSDEMIPKYMKNVLETKSKAVAWFVSNCYTQSEREVYATALKRELGLLNQTLDIYGNCGSLRCPVEDMGRCWRDLENDYYFYLSFENSFSKDYVTEKFLYAMQHNVVPIVWGGADYSRFAPPHSYINARLHTAKELANIIDNYMKNLEKYGKYFNWKNHYKYKSSYDGLDTNPFCKLCEALNLKSKNTKIYDKFRNWWNT